MGDVPDLGDVREVDGLWLTPPTHFFGYACFRHTKYKPNKTVILSAFTHKDRKNSWSPSEKLLYPLTLTDW